MKLRHIWKRAVDFAMTLALLFLMGYQFWGDTAHEWVGAGMFVLFIVHHALNGSWFRALFKGRYTRFRLLVLAVDLLTFLAMLGLMVSGVMLSRTVFAFLPIRGGLSFARLLHMVSAYWGFVLMALHLGLHWQTILKSVRRGKQRSSWVWTLLGAVIAGYGAYVFFQRGLSDYLLLRAQFAFLDFSESKLRFYLDYLSMMGTFLFLAHYAAKITTI